MLSRKSIIKSNDDLHRENMQLIYDYTDVLNGRKYPPEEVTFTRNKKSFTRMSSGCNVHHLFGRAFAVRWLKENSCILSVYNHFKIPPNGKDSIAISEKLNGKKITEELQRRQKLGLHYSTQELIEINNNLKQLNKELKNGH